MTFGSSGTGTGMDNSISKIREREGNEKNPFPQFVNGNQRGSKILVTVGQNQLF